MPRAPITLSEAQKAEVETLAAVLSTEQIADYFGIGRRTFWDLMARDAEIAARYKRGKARAVGAVAQGLIQKARSGDTACMIFFLKTQAGWRETAAVEQSLPPEPAPDRTGTRALILARLDEIAARQQTLAIEEAEVAPCAAPEGAMESGP